MSTGPARVGYFFGEDAYSLERAVERMARTLGEAAPPEIWRVSGEDDDAGGAAAPGISASETTSAGRQRARVLEQIEQRVGAAPLFAGGTLVHVRQPASLMRDAASRDRLLALVSQVPAGNGLAFTDLVPGPGRRTAAGDALLEAVERAGGVVQEFSALTRDRMERWIEERSRDLDVRLGPGAGRLLAERVGAYVRESDVDRRRQTELVNSELEKLSLLRPGGTIDRSDVAELVPEAVPGSMWGFLDAVGARRGVDAARLAERLLSDGMPLPVLVSQLHRRLRELIGVRDLLDGGTRPSELPRILKLQPYRAERLSQQAAAWTVQELEEALFGLLELDLESKGIGLDGAPLSVSDEKSLLSLAVWLSERVPKGGDPGRVALGR